MILLGGKYRMKKSILTCVILLITISLAGCNKPFVVPNQSDFSTTASIPDKILKTGETYEVDVTLHNSSDSKYTLRHSGLHYVVVKDMEGKDVQPFITTLVGLESEIQGKGKISGKPEAKIDKPGKYQVIGISMFAIVDPDNDERKEFFIESEPIIVEVFDHGVMEHDAISLALTAYKQEFEGVKETDFPLQPGTLQKEVPMGGPAGTKTTMELTTKVEQDSAGNYFVTFVKDYNVKIGDKEVISHWKYKVTNTDVLLIDSEDNDNSMAIIK
jgi:hypothetical protein